MTSVVSVGTTELMIVRTVCKVLRAGAGMRKRYSSTVFGAAEVGLRLLETNLFTVNLPRLDEQQLNVLRGRSSRVRDSKPNHSTIYCDLAYSALAATRIGMSGSASFQRSRNDLYAVIARTRAASASAPCAVFA